MFRSEEFETKIEVTIDCDDDGFRVAAMRSLDGRTFVVSDFSPEENWKLNLIAAHEWGNINFDEQLRFDWEEHQDRMRKEDNQ